MQSNPPVHEEKPRPVVLGMHFDAVTVQQALDEHCRLANENADVHASALMEMKALLKAGDLEGAQKYAERMNKEFREMGIEEVKVPRENVTDEAVKAVRAREVIEKIREKKESKNETEY